MLHTNASVLKVYRLTDRMSMDLLWSVQTSTAAAICRGRQWPLYVRTMATNSIAYHRTLTHWTNKNTSHSSRQLSGILSSNFNNDHGKKKFITNNIYTNSAKIYTTQIRKYKTIANTDTRKNMGICERINCHSHHRYHTLIWLWNKSLRREKNLMKIWEILPHDIFNFTKHI